MLVGTRQAITCEVIAAILDPFDIGVVVVRIGCDATIYVKRTWAAPHHSQRRRAWRYQEMDARQEDA